MGAEASNDEPGKKEMKQYECICGRYLMKVDDKVNLYGNGSAICDICYAQYKPNHIFWHCDKNNVHENGFDICDKCIAQYSISDIRTARDIIDFTAIEAIRIHNDDKDESNMSNQQLLQNKTDYKSILVSNHDEQLMILIEFTKYVDLKSIVLYAFTESVDYIISNNDDEHDISAPKRVHIYKIDNINKEMTDITSLSPDLTTDIPSSTEKMELIPKQYASSLSVKCLAIYIESNQNDTEKTYLNGIEIISTKSPKPCISDEKEKQDIDELINDYSKNEAKFAKTGPLHLYQDPTRYSMHENCKLSECKSLRELIHIFRRYRKFIDVNNNNDDEQKFDYNINKDIVYHELEDTVSDKTEHKTIATIDTDQECPYGKGNEKVWEETQAILHKMDQSHNALDIQLQNKEHIQMSEEQMRQKVLIYAMSHPGNPNEIMTQFVSNLMKIKQQQQQRAVDKQKTVETLMKTMESTQIQITSINYKLKDPKKVDLIDNLYADSYQNVHLINDFHHLFSVHGHQFEEIYNIFIDPDNIGKCNVSNCLLFSRNHRDRLLMRDNDEKMDKMYFNLDNQYNVVQQQLLDKLHCFYFHTFDTGYKLTKHEMQQIMDEESKESESNSDTDEFKEICYNNTIYQMNQLNNKKRALLANTKELRDENQISKFVTKITDDELIYANGFRFFYWDFDQIKEDWTQIDESTSFMKPKAANHGYTKLDWYIAHLFENFKVEILNNKICTISLYQWKNLVRSAQTHIVSDYFKNISCYKKIYGMKEGSPITVKHVIAMMLYCNYDFLQQQFSATYRKIKPTETNEDLKGRHQNYAHFGRLLRECVECFGCSNVGYLDFQHLKLYHGISRKAHFSSSVVCFKGPVSTTTNYCVAQNFSTNQGTILELNLGFSWSYSGTDRVGMAMFECFWLSDYPNEQERFFIGGYGDFSIVKIILAATAIDYTVYTYALCRLWENIQSEGAIYSESNMKSDIDINVVNQTFFRLLLHELYVNYPDENKYVKFVSIPLYIERLLHKQCAALRKIDLFTSSCNKFIQRVMEKYFIDDEGWINLDVLMTVFPLIEHITFTLQQKNHQFMQKSSVYKSILSFLQKHPHSLLQKIDIHIPNTTESIQKARNICKIFHTQFNQLQCVMIVNVMARSFPKPLDCVYIQIQKDLDETERNFQSIYASK